METVVDKYAERLQTMTDSALIREWNAESGDRLRQIEHEMATRFRKPRPQQLYYLNKFLDLPEQFCAACDAKEWYKAKNIYDTALRVGLFLEIPQQLSNEVFGISAEDEEEIHGLIPRDLVSRVFLECAVKDNLGLNCVVYRVPGEIGFYGARHRPGITRLMPAEENPAFWIQDPPVAL